MEAIAASKVLFFNSNALSKSFIRYHHHHHHHRFVCYLQSSRDNQQLKLVTSEETLIVKPVLKALSPKPKPKPKRIPKLVELTVQGLFLSATVGSAWIYNVILPKTYDLMISDATEFSDSQLNKVVSAYTSLEFEMLIVVLLFLTLKLICIHEDECMSNGNRMSVAFKLAGGIIICVFVGCSLRLVSLAHARDSWLSTRGHGPWHLILVLLFIVLNITGFGAFAIEDIRQLENRVNTQSCVGSGTQVGELKDNTQICVAVGSGTQDGDSKDNTQICVAVGSGTQDGDSKDNTQICVAVGSGIQDGDSKDNTQICVAVGSGTQDGDSKSRKKSRRRGIILLNKHLGRVRGLGGHVRSLAEEEQ